MDAESLSGAASALRRRRRIVLAAVWAISGMYAFALADRGWIPHDEGTIAQSAQRVLSGELPHRDYDEGYTGGLTWVHAVAFRVLGVRLFSLRLVLFVLFLAFVPTVYAIALRVARPASAGLLTLLAVAWSVPNYFASLPSWYNLFLATFGVFALVRHVDTGRRRWLVAAGVCAGLSVLCKVVGLYDIAAVVLFLVYREQRLAAARPGAEGGGLSPFLALKVVGGGLFLGAVVGLLRGRLEPMDGIHFLCPAAAIVGFLVWSEWKEGKGSMAERWREVWNLFAPFAVGVCVPLAFFLVPYLRAGAVPDLLQGVFVRPLRQIETARRPFPPPSTLWPAAPYALLLAFPGAFVSMRRRSATIAFAFLLGLGLVCAAHESVYQVIWDSARSIAVVAVLVGCGRLAWLAGRAGPAEADRQVAFLLICATALVSFVQFPFSAPIYFCYVAPLAALAVAATIGLEPQAPRPLHMSVLVFYLLFAAAWMNPGYIFNLGHHPAKYLADAPLALARAGLRVPAADARVYEALVAEIRRRAGDGQIYAGPDCPEVYFLGGYGNPTRDFFDFMEPLYGRIDSILRLIDERQIKVVVLNRSPDFSRPPAPELQAAIRERFPRSVEIGKFTLFWRD